GRPWPAGTSPTAGTRSTPWPGRRRAGLTGPSAAPEGGPPQLLTVVPGPPPMARGTATGRQARTLPSCRAGGPNTLLRYRPSRESRLVTATIAAGRQYLRSDRSWAVDGATAPGVPSHRWFR